MCMQSHPGIEMNEKIFPSKLKLIMNDSMNCEKCPDVTDFPGCVPRSCEHCYYPLDMR